MPCMLRSNLRSTARPQRHLYCLRSQATTTPPGLLGVTQECRYAHCLALTPVQARCNDSTTSVIN